VSRELRVAFEAVDRPDLGEQFRGGDGSAARKLEQCRRRLRGAELKLLIELFDRLGERPDPRRKFAGKLHLELLVLASEPAADAFEMRGTSEQPQRHCEGRVELEEMPTKPLLRATALLDKVVAMIDKQLDLDVDLLTWPRPRQIRLPQRRARDREPVDRVRLPTSPTRSPLRHRQLRRHPHKLLTQAQ